MDVETKVLKNLRMQGNLLQILVLLQLEQKTYTLLFMHTKRIYISLLLFLLVDLSMAAQETPAAVYPKNTWGIQWPLQPDNGQYAGFDFNAVQAVAAGSAWLTQGHLYFFGTDGTPQNLQEAFNCYSEAAALLRDETSSTVNDSDETVPAEEGAPEEGGSSAFTDAVERADGTLLALPPATDAAYHLALCHLFGLGTERSESSANYWLRIGIQAGDVRCEMLQAILDFRSGSYTTAIDIFANLSTVSDYATLWLCEGSLWGRGMVQDERGAVQRLHALAERIEGFKQSDAETGSSDYWRSEDELAYAYLRLADCYENGVGTKRKPALAAELREKAAAIGAHSGSVYIRRLLPNTP